ncbi:hypothetical protein FNV43_RR00671 [Rhamnella rubrinervis]|uniref:Uncharacterized protein n=1 Tax=Rhamnella rubrinervis TaxID=2594499 RepID=A0A8K0HR34_9ROSA|nr:hypothetical protein FNV43_RR00671 [Rhamnella rubrinervis]
METKSTTVAKKSIGSTAIGNTFSMNEKKSTGFVTMGNVNRETGEPVMASDESLIDDLRYQIEGLRNQVVRVGEKISGVGQSIEHSHGNTREGCSGRRSGTTVASHFGRCPWIPADLSRLYRKESEIAGSFLAHIKRARNRKKFIGMEFRDLFELATRTTLYEDILNEKYQRKNSSKGTYYKDLNLDINLVDFEMLLKFLEKGGKVYDVDNNSFPAGDLVVRLTKGSQDSGQVENNGTSNNMKICQDLDLGMIKNVQKVNVILRGYENEDHEVGLLGAPPSVKFDYYVQYLKPDNYHQYPIKPTGWDLDKPRQHDVHSTTKCTERRNWTTKTFRPPIKNVGRWYQVEKDGIVDPLAETSNAKDDVTTDSLAKISKDKDDDSLAKTSKAETTNFMTDKISSASDDDELLNKLKSYLYEMKGQLDPLKNFKPTYKG